MIPLHKHKSASHPNSPVIDIEATYQNNRNSNPHNDIHQRNKQDHPN